MNRVYLLLFFCFGCLINLMGQAEVDTTSESYKKQYEVGYQIGQWLPFIIIITLVILVMVRARRLSKD